MGPAPESLPTPARAYVLVAEDEVLVRALLAGQLREAGLTVVEAGNADEAWAYISSDARVDLVFSDVEMPGSMSGLELARRIRSRNAALPIILTSGRGWPSAEGGLGAFIPKPYDLDRVISIVLATLGLSRPDG